ncbi:MAG: tyrosine protein phosphatase [Deltaproteobacteria bacterium]|nr:tyrosine protein phosphatase [Deltaproteobacteria bacterium]
MLKGGGAGPQRGTHLIDIHAHILPGMDDGPATLDQSLEMARVAVEDGIRTMISTPHCLNGRHSNWRQEMLTACETFNAQLRQRQIPLTVLPGSEACLAPELAGEIEKGRLMTLNDTGRYFFLELPDQFIPEAVKSLINRLKRDKITAIITHPERNATLQQNMDLLSDFVLAGALSQVTAGSITGQFGRHIYKCSAKIVKMQMAHFVASDAHSPTERPPKLFSAIKKLTSVVGKTRAERMMFDFPQAVLDGKDIQG